MKTKLLPVLQVGARNQELAFSVEYELKSRLTAGCVPVFSTDGLKHYFYALTAHFGRWGQGTGKKPSWVLLADFLYGQMIKREHRGKTVEIERHLLWGEEKHYRERLCGACLSGRIYTAFVERLNPLAPPARAGVTIRKCVSKLTRCTWGPARYTPELMKHLEYP